MSNGISFMKKSTLKMLKTWSLGILLASFAASANAATQTVTPSTSSSTLASDATDSITYSYSVSDDDNSLTGLGMYLIYDPSKVSISASNVLSTSSLGVTDASDTANLDSDANTTDYLSFSWADPFSVNWPNAALPTDLFDLTVTSMLGSNESTTINIYFSSSASGYDATGTAVTINGPDQTGPVITATDATETATGLNTLSYTIPSTITAVDGVDGDVSGTLSVTVDGGVTTYSMGNNVSLALGSHTLLWTAQDSSSNDSTDSQTITVVPADASDSQSMLTSVVSSANVSSSNTLTVTIKDAYGNARSGDTVTFALTQPTNGSTGSVTASAVTDASGTATATLVLSELAGSNVVTATTGSVTETVTVTGTVTALAASSSTIVSGNASATAGQATTINVTVADASGTAITGQPVFLAVSGNATVSSQPTATDASGTTTGTITNNTAESVTVTAYIGSSVSDTAISDTHAVTYNAASASQLSLSTLRVMSAESTDTVTVTVTLQDQFGNIATSATDTVSFAETGAQASFSPTSIAASSGTATSVLTTSYTDSNDASFVVTVSSGSMTDASATVNIRAFSLSNSAGALSGNNYIKTGTSLSLQLAGGSNSTWAVTDSTGAVVTSSRLTNATDTGATYTAPSSNATDTITVTRSVASTDASTTLTLISLPQVVMVRLPLIRNRT
jgi:adhesin/invasin